MENKETNQPTTSNTQNQIPDSEQIPLRPKKTNTVLVPLLLVIILLLLGSTSFFAYHYFQSKTLNTETQRIPLETNATPEQKIENKTQKKFEWKNHTTANSKIKTDSLKNELYKSPSITKILESESLLEYSCLDLNYQIPLEKIKVSIENEFLLNGIEKISEHIFTKPLQREDGTPLDPIKAKYQISFTSVCELSEDSFVAIFLTTQQLPDELSLIPQVHAAGGWLGDSHMAIIESSNLEIYERFPFEAELVELPTIEEEPVLLRFGAYYNCREIVGITKDRILIDCHNNIYSFNRQTTTFKELSICGSYFNANSYRTERFTCFGQSGEIYFDKEESIE